MSFSKIFEDPLELVPLLETHRALGRRIVFANGCFELLHVGHVRYLAAAKELGDVLIVAVNTDDSIRLIKPDRRPVNPDRERMEILAALDSVDYVVPLTDKTPVGLIEMFRPHVQAKGTDYTLDRLPERHVLERLGGRVAFVGGPKIRSTSDMLRAMKEGALAGA